MKPGLALLFSLLSMTSGVSAAPAIPAAEPIMAAARVAKAEYCFAVVRRLQPDKSPPPPLVLRIHLDVSYRNTAARPIILPLLYERTLYTSLMPGVMKVTGERLGLFAPSVPIMMRLPANVNPANPVDPPNDEFRIIPPGGQMPLPVDDVITVPIHRDFRPKVDLRGKTLYLRMKFAHRQLAPGLEDDLSDRWTRFGAPWTGNVLTNTLVIHIPALPAAVDCIDK